nr:MAG TPA: hypothetical protein [Caudoviricetes sp.]
MCSIVTSFLYVVLIPYSELDLLHVSPLFGICQEVFFRMWNFYID